MTVPGFIFFAFGIPALGYWYIKNFREKVKASDHLTNPKVRENTNFRYRMCCGFLITGF